MEARELRHLVGQFIVATAALLAFSQPTPSSCDAARLTSGYFEGLMLAVDSGGNITGYFRQQQGEGVVKTCAFFLAGKGASGEIPIVTWNAQAFQGTIKPERQGITVKVERGREHPGCGLVLSPEIARGLELDRITEAKWIDLRQIAQERVRFHSAPDAAHVLRSFVVSGDVVGVISERGDWIEVEYRGDKRTSGGWILTRTTRKLLPPERPNANRR